MARPGRPGSIRGEAQRRGISEYQVRKERGEGRRLNELSSLRSLARRTGGSNYEAERKAMLRLYNLTGYNHTRTVLLNKLAVKDARGGPDLLAAQLNSKEQYYAEEGDYDDDDWVQVRRLFWYN